MGSQRRLVVLRLRTQFDKADITDLKGFRKGWKEMMEKQRYLSWTPLPFLIKAVAQAMVAKP